MGIPSKEMLIRKAGDPKVLPSVAKKVLDMVGDENTSNTALCTVISRDQTISASVLKIANSAYYGLRNEVTSLNQAVVILGFAALKDLVVTVSTKLQYKRFGITEQMMWDHSIGAAVAAREVARGHGRDLEEMAFLGGLMHDFGKVVMNNEAPEAYLEVMQETYNEGKDAIEAETSVFGYTHTEIGAMVLDQWGFPPVLISVLRSHHLQGCTLEGLSDPFEARAIACIHLADALCKRLGIGYRCAVGELQLDRLPSAVFLGLDSGKIERLSQAASDKYEAEKAAFG